MQNEYCLYTCTLASLTFENSPEIVSELMNDKEQYT